MISVLIITFNEELHLERCIKSVSRVSDDIIIVDSFSNDDTENISARSNVRFYQNEWTNHSTQINWALDNVDFKNEFVLRVDADEYLMDELVHELKCKVIDSPPADNINGLVIKRRTYFMGRWIRHGGYYPTKLLRLWRKGHARCEDRVMDEHMILLDGHYAHLEHDFIDENLAGLSSWTSKHNSYSNKELEEFYREKKSSANNADVGVATKNRNRKSVYYRTPIFLRAFGFFFYRYLFRLGFLDGKEGFIYYVLQSFWYRFLIDAKIYEKEKAN
ncbi:glycosyltransferase family 2 protein [Vibrio cyclitrophicus]|uniref:glycosyltransferase family 2 protein n=1 Tax=Vibrio cyclitrophicus TaxID=47951 RepID=UPI000C841140|nr:glycosyltransferase family 2 protein [Vibrio cyclitrophicus]PMI06555.1 hypothetical protein BCU52_17715 [Vibrio cyclitrophicus]